MKQLLQTFSDASSFVLIAGLHDAAYLVSEKSSVYKLNPPQDETTIDDPNEIQAVSVFLPNQTEIWCAVSRRSKTLSLYCYKKNNTNSEESLSPTTVYKTSKRVCCLEFATVPPSNNESEPLHVIVAGDLIGDVTAFPVMSQQDVSSSRLLLGHTASVLTGVKVVSNGNKMRILTSDRDEKIRVSQFPETHIVETYLLGHTAFVTAMDAAADCTRCVSCGGDGTIRLWDYVAGEQVALVETPQQEAVEEEEIDAKEGKAVTDQQIKPLVPTAISITPCGVLVAVIFDKYQTLHMYRVSNDDQLVQCQTIECPTQPLAVRFADNHSLFVVSREPDYCIAYHQSNDDSLFAAVATHECCAALKRVATSDKVSMPTTLLETDKKSGKTRLKLKEKEQRPHNRSWNNAERIQIAKERNARRHKRKREAKAEGRQQGGDLDNDSN